MGFTALIPHFHYSHGRNIFGSAYIGIVLTTAGAAHYNRKLGSNCLRSGLTVGYLMTLDNGFQVHNAERQRLGEATHRMEAQEELVRLYVRQRR